MFLEGTGSLLLCKSHTNDAGSSLKARAFGARHNTQIISHGDRVPRRAGSSSGGYSCAAPGGRDIRGDGRCSPLSMTLASGLRWRRISGESSPAVSVWLAASAGWTATA